MASVNIYSTLQLVGGQMYLEKNVHQNRLKTTKLIEVIHSIQKCYDDKPLFT